MRSVKHQGHIDTRIAYSDCRECRADTERRFVEIARWDYRHVHEYLCYIEPLLRAIRDGNDSVAAQQWLRDFRLALNRRINLKTGTMPRWRKLCNSYQERLARMRHVRDRAYLRNFARAGASALD